MTQPFESRTTRTRRLLAAGVVAGPLFVVVVLIQLAITPGFDLNRHPISLLSLSEIGWIQIANFVLGGLLAIAFAIGARRVLTGRGSAWGPRLLALYGLGLVAGGVFLADPGLGFPPGTPDGIPSTFSWHGTIHAFAPPAALTALIVAVIVFARRFAERGERGWVIYSALTVVAAVALVISMGFEGGSLRLALASAIGWAWVSALANRLLARGENTAEPAPGRLIDSASPAIH
jgi:hypothetical protein